LAGHQYNSEALVFHCGRSQAVERGDGLPCPLQEVRIAILGGWLQSGSKPVLSASCRLIVNNLICFGHPLNSQA